MPRWPVNFSDLLSAQERISEVLKPTPVRNYPKLDQRVGHGISVWVKHEDQQPTGSFKVRNGLSALGALDAEAKARGVLAATRGNHGQGVAFAAQRMNIPCTICVPYGNSLAKNRAMRALGAKLVEYGDDYDSALAYAEQLQKEDGLTMIHSTNNSDVIAGAGSIALELLEQVPDLDALFVSVGGGSQAVGSLVAARHLKPELPVYGVGAQAAPAQYQSFHEGRAIASTQAQTIADGLATRHTYSATREALRDGLRDFLSVSESEIQRAISIYIEDCHSLSEGAGATSLAGLVQAAPSLKNKKVGVILSGANIDIPVLQEALSQAHS